MIDTIEQELAKADFGDERLTKRAVNIFQLWSAAPTASFPAMAPISAERQGLYEFFENESVEHGPLLATHRDQTLQRIQKNDQDTVLILHDTTSFAFGGEVPRKDLGWLGHDQQGFFAHVSLAVSADGTRLPHGVLKISIWMRPRPPRRNEKKTKPKHLTSKKRASCSKRESVRWTQHVIETDSLLRPRVLPIHIMDREADFYEHCAKMLAGGCHFVLRARELDRSVMGSEDQFTQQDKLHVIAERSTPFLERQVHLNQRRKSAFPGQEKKHPPRQARDAKLAISATTIRMVRPQRLDHTLPSTLDMNVVHVREVDAPENVEPVEWFLLTSEPIDSEENVLRVVDFYRARWTIEEYFKAIKSGCAYETRQLKSARALLVALAICIPIAWQMLALRTQGRMAPEAPATTVITQERLDVLRTITPKPLVDKPTALQVYIAIASLGGYIPGNGLPGWKTLRTGLDKLLFAEQVLAAQRVRGAPNVNENNRPPRKGQRHTHAPEGSAERER